MGADTADFYESLGEPVLTFPVIALLVFIALPLAAYLGHRFGSHERQRRGYDKVPADKLPGGTTLGALLALLGLLLGFAFSSSINWREARQTALVEEAAAIGSAFLSADLLAPDGRDPLQQVILAYAQTRLASPEDVSTRIGIDAFMTRTRTAQSEIWPATQRALAAAPSEPVKTLVAGNVMEMLDAHTRRIGAGGEHIPKPAMLMLVGAALIAISIVGNRSALQGRPLTWRTFTFAGVLSVVIVIIVDLDRSFEGTMRQNPDPMTEVIHDMEAALAQR